MKDNSFLINGGIEVPYLFQGLPLINFTGGTSKKEFVSIIERSIKKGITGFDTSHDYGKSEKYIGDAIKILKKCGIDRDQMFLLSKIGNGQQYIGNIEECVDISLKTIGVDYLDCMLLHWPVPDRYIENWSKLEDVFLKGKVRSIGIANAQIRHIEKLLGTGVRVTPHIIQTEIHPFNSCSNLREYCNQKDIHLLACSSLCMMIEKVKSNKILNDISTKHQKSIAQIMLKWLLQDDISPVFRAFSSKHIDEMAELDTFNLCDDEMQRIDGLNENFRYHPESINCPGF